MIENIIESVVSGVIVALILEFVWRKKAETGQEPSAPSQPRDEAKSGDRARLPSDLPGTATGKIQILTFALRVILTPVIGYMLAAFYSGAIMAMEIAERGPEVFDITNPLTIALFVGFSILAWVFLDSLTSGRRQIVAQLAKAFFSVLGSVFLTGLLLALAESQMGAELRGQNAPAFILIVSMLLLGLLWGMLNVLWPARRKPRMSQSQSQG